MRAERPFLNFLALIQRAYTIIKLIFERCAVILINMSVILEKPKIIVKNGRPRSVVLDIKDYERLLELVADREDLMELKLIKKSKTYFRELNDYLKKSV